MTALDIAREHGILGPAQFDRLAEVRRNSPERIAAAHAERVRPVPNSDGRLFLVAADHPARGSLDVGGRPGAMADRHELLARLAVALTRPGVDGVLATPDIIDDLALLGVLDGKVVAGSMNRGGLHGSSFEMDDRFTAYDIDALVRDRLDFAKVLLRINLQDHGTAATLEGVARAVSAAAARRLPIMIEPFLSIWDNGSIRHDLSADAVITAVAISAGLGNSSAYTWLKLPVVDEMERVMAATSLPTLLLGGDPTGDPDPTYEKWSAALSLDGVHGLVVGRALLYPADDDVVAAVDTAATLVHGSPIPAHAG